MQHGEEERLEEVKNEDCGVWRYRGRQIIPSIPSIPSYHLMIRITNTAYREWETGSLHSSLILRRDGQNPIDNIIILLA